MESRPSNPKARILAATAVAVAVAAVLLVVAVLPAEYGIDPLGTGRVLGLTALARPTPPVSAPGPSATAPSAIRNGSHTAEPAPFHRDVYEVELRPYEGVEYKYRMEKDATLVYSWQASASVGYEFHGEPDGAPKRYFDSYEKAEKPAAHGAFTAPTSGIHGWYWENKGPSRVKVTLTTAGFFGDATEFRDGERIVHAMAGK